MTCECRVCKYGRDVQHQLSFLTKAQTEFFEDMYDQLMHAEFDRDYYSCIVKGTWPQSEEILAQYRSQSS